MKKIVYSLLICVFTVGVLMPFNLKAQLNPRTSVPTEIFGEHFDKVPSLWKMTSSWKPSNQQNEWYRDTIVTRDMSPGSATDTLNRSGQGFTAATYLTTPKLKIDKIQYTNFGFSFYHICYIGPFNDGAVEYSFDSAGVWTTWKRMPSSNYNGPSLYDFMTPNGSDLKFSVLSNPTKWRSKSDSVIWPRNTDAWVREDFDLTSLIYSSANPVIPDSFRVRLALIDDKASAPGDVGYHRWIVDNFIANAGNCELIPPDLNLFDPPRNYPQRYEGRVYSLGPYDFDAQIIDASTIDTAYIEAILLREVTMGAKFDTLVVDTFPMVPLGSGSNYRGKIEKFFIKNTMSGPDTSFVLRGDSIAWRLVARDATDCKNERQNPPQGHSKFIVINDLPKSCNSQPIYKFPYYQDFDNLEFGLGGQDILVQDWDNIRGDFHQWWVNKGSTPTDSTGPSDDYPGGGNYLYVEGSGYEDSSAYLVSPCMDFDREILPNGLIKFFVNMNTTSIEDTINVDIFDSRPTPGRPFGGFVENVIPPITGNKGDKWIPFEFSVYPYSNSVTQLRFRGTPGNNSGFNDMALDSFKVIPAALIDLRLNAIDLPPFSPIGVRDPVHVNIQNLGIADVTAMDFSFQVCPLDGACRPVRGPFSWTGLVPAGKAINDVLNETYEVPAGGFELKVWFDYGPDILNNNDTAVMRSVGLQYNSVVCHRDEFDGENYWISPGEANSLENKWELGTPNYDRTNTVITPPNAWDVLLNRPYTGTGITNSLISPFFNLSNADSVLLTFLNNRDIDTTKDGVWIEYSLDRGLSWSFLENFDDDPLQKKWYNSSLSAAGVGGTPVFADRTSCYPDTWLGWLESEILLPNYLDFEKEVLFRFQFFAEDDDDGNDGMSIDNLLVYNMDNNDLEVEYKLSPNSKCDLTNKTHVESIIKNRGLDDVSTFEIEYRLLHIPTNTLVTKTDVVNRTLNTRDTIHVRSQSEMDMSVFGDYQLDIIAKLPSDACSNNDTLSSMVENIRGCSFQFLIENSFRENKQIKCDSSVWKFNYTSGGRDYVVSGAYNDPEYAIGKGKNPPLDTIKNLYVCIKENSQVEFELNDIDTLVEAYSFVAFNGENDTVIRQSIPGGPDSPPQYFNWVCPPDRSATPIELRIDNEVVQLPVSKEYRFEPIILNNGLDSLDSVQVFLQIDQQASVLQKVPFGPELRYNRKRKIAFPPQFLSPGEHCINIWTKLPNGQFDQIPGDDTLQRCLTIMDTIITNTGPNDTLPKNYYSPFCENFEDGADNVWLAFNPYTTSQENVSFERALPSSPNISPWKNSKAWVTNASGDYPNLDESALLSPFIYLEKDSCYNLSFKNNYYITDSIQDGATIRIITKAALSNQFKIGNSLGDTNALGDTVINGPRNWYNTLHVLSIPDNSKNSGWTGNSGGWVNSRNLLSTQIIGENKSQYVALMFRFEADGSKTSDGWAVDDVCIQNINAAQCMAVGIPESLFETTEAYLGQNIPNPAEYSTSIPYYLPKNGKVEFIVRNILGQPVFIETSMKPKGDGVIQLDLSSMAKGLYYYTMIYEGRQFTKKMIISK